MNVLSESETRPINTTPGSPTVEVSQKRIDANRRNALLSTDRGPKKEKSTRAISLTHGLYASTVVPEDAKSVRDRTEELYDALRPQNDWHCLLVSEIALLTLRLDRAGRMDRRFRDKIAIRAELSRNSNKRIEADLLGGQLGIRPAVVEKLRATPQRYEWLMSRWAMLAYLADQGMAWTLEQEQVAFDLMGTPHDFRVGIKSGVSLDFRGKVVDEGNDPAALARHEIDALTERLEEVDGLDQADRALSIADLYDDDDDPELKRLRKQEGTLHSRLSGCLRQVKEEAPPRECPRWLKRKWLGDAELPKPLEIPTAPLP
jgi:hypothetical protein